MERRVIFQDGMDNDPDDYNNLQDYVQGTFDDVVGDAITSGRKYAGFAAAATSVTAIAVQIGRFYSGGKVYTSDAIFTQDFTTSLPVATKKIANIVVYGQEIDTNSVPREFLINEDTGQSEPRVVATERERQAVVNVVFGSENADPVAPVTDAATIVIATVLLTPSGISSVTMNADNALDSVSSNTTRIVSLEKFASTAAPQITSLASDLSALANGQRNTVTLDSYGRTLARLASLEAKDGIPASASDSDCDFFLDTSKSDLTFSGSQVKIDEGIRFADEAANVTQLSIFNALNPLATITGGVMFPAYTLDRRFATGSWTGEVQASQYSYQTNTLVQKTMSRTRVRYGSSMTVCTNSTWWKSGKYDATTHIFSINGETWTVDPSDYAKAVVNHQMIRVTEFWEDSYEEPYWDAVTVTNTVPGAVVAETFLNANDMWLGGIELGFTRLAANGSVTVSICETENGMPKLDQVISTTTIQRADLQLGADANGYGKTYPIQPVFLSGGQRYAIVVITAADHWLATVQGTTFPQGTFFYVLDGAYQQGDGTRDMAFALYAAKFTASRAVIDLQPLSLSGGIANIDIIAPSVVPGSTSLTFEVQLASVWYPLSQVSTLNLGAGGSIPPLLPFRATFVGTPDVMPAITLTSSQVTISRPRTSLTSISQPRVLPGSGSSQIRVIARFEYWDSAHHTASCNLLTGASYTTVQNASSFSDVVTDDGATERTWVFNLGAAVTSYRIKFGATTDSALDTFHFAFRKDYAL